jgi:ketosteroid isomerase-like protein
MRDECEIQDLISRYSDAITRRDWPVVSSVFAAEASWQVVGVPEYRFEGDKVGSGIRGLVEPANYLIQMSTRAIVQVDGDTATARSTVFETGEYEAGRFQPFKCRFESFGIYADRLRKDEGRWRFASREFTMLNMRITRLDEAKS